MTRPTGVTILAVVSFISGLLGLCGAAVLFLGGIVGLLVPPVGILILLLAFVVAAGPLLQILFAYGAWNLRPWAWLLGVAAMGISVASSVISLFSGVGLLSAVLNGLIPIIVFVYLLLPDTRRAFGLDGTTAPGSLTVRDV
jgi:hypothetical protein